MNMTDIREKVKDALMTVSDNVKMTKPSGDVEIPLICYAETENTSINIAHDRVKYRVAVYAGSFEDLVEIVKKVDKVMCNVLGFQRTAKSSDENSKIGTDLYLCRLDYTATVNLIYNYILRNSITI